MKKLFQIVIISFSIYFIINAIRIYRFSKVNTTNDADIAIVLGAGTYNGNLSPVFRERVNHSITLYETNRIKKIIFTGGFGVNEKISDSQAAKNYAIVNGVQEKDIFIEEKSKYTIQNLIEAKILIDSLDLKTALLVSDPLHMKRSIDLAEKIDIECFSSPTQTSMYKSKKAKSKFILYETFYFTLGEISGRN